MLGRRGFLRTIGAAVLGMSLALKAPEEKPDLKPEGWSDSESGIAVRLTRHWDAVHSAHVNQMDVYYGTPATYWETVSWR